MPKWFVVSVALLGLNTLAVVGTTVVSKSFANDGRATQNVSEANASHDANDSQLDSPTSSSGSSSTLATGGDQLDVPAREISEQTSGESERPTQHSAANIPLPDELKVPSLGDPTKDPFFQELRALVSEQNSGLLSQTSPLDSEANNITRAQSQEYFARLKHRLEVVSHLISAAQGLTAEAERQSNSPLDAHKAADSLRQIMQLREMIGKLATQEL